MSHDDFPLHHARDGNDRLQPLESSGQGSLGRPSQYSDSADASVHPNWGQYRSPDEPSISGIDGEVVSLGPIIGQSYSGPIPPPYILDGYERIQKGLGKRILDDAHDDTVADRRITQKAFDFAMWEAKAGFVVAITISLSAIVGIVCCLFFLEPPESLAGAGILGLASLTPLVRTFLHRDQQGDQQGSANDNAPAGPEEVRKR